MKNYKKGKIYRLTCANLDLVYYGSTIQDLENRLNKHFNDYSAYIQNKEYSNYCYSFKLIEAGDVEIELVMECPSNSKRELEEIEQTFIENDICINHQRAFATKEQRLEDNRILDRKRCKNPERIEYCKKNRQENRMLLKIVEEMLK